MGASSSKTDSSGDPQWKVSGPPSVSLDVIETLQSSPETDASRSRLIEAHIQARVAEELKKLQQREADALRRVHEDLASAAAKTPIEQDDATPSRAAVAAEIDALRRKLEDRRRVRDVPEGVDKARSAVVRCLRENDRRPLDCWQEVQAFKAEVKRLEKEWVDRVIA